MEKNFFLFLQLIEYVAVVLRGKIEFFHGSVKRYKPLRSSTNYECGNSMMQFVGIA